MNPLDECRTTWAEDEDVESTVLRRLLDLHPTRVTLEELTREVGSGDRAFRERDAIERAVRELDAVGLLHRVDAFLTPTRAALRFSELLDR
jgi:negative regulator of replication initiation